MIHKCIHHEFVLPVTVEHDSLVPCPLCHLVDILEEVRDWVEDTRRNLHGRISKRDAECKIGDLEDILDAT